jgi:5'-3' exonuclease
MKRVALIDADVLVWLASYGMGEYDLHIAKKVLQDKVKTILDESGAFEYMLFIGGKNNFRYHIDRNYKANRVGTEKPILFNDVKAHIRDHWGAFVSNGCETDDSIVATAKWLKEEGKEPIVCSIDKDFLTKEGLMYKWSRSFGKKVTESEIITTNKDEANLNFAIQMLMGDKADNIKGIRGMGVAKSTKLLKGKTRWQMLLAIARLYKSQYGSKWLLEMTTTFRLLHLVDDYNVIDIPKRFYHVFNI